MYLVKTIIVVFLSIFASLCLANTDIHLSKQELQFIKDNPVVKMGSGESFEPFIFKDENGKTVGYDRQVADLIEQKTGLKIKFEFGPWDEIQIRAEQGELDGLSTVAISEERQLIYNFSKSYLQYTAITIVNRANPQKIYKQEDVQNKKAAVQRGNVGFEQMTKTLGDVEIIYYDDIYSVLNAVINNEVDFTILDESVYYVANKLGVSDFIATSFVVRSGVDTYFAFNKKHPLLESIVNKALDDISPYKMSEIKANWFEPKKQTKVNFTEIEREYLYQRKSLTYCINPDFYPIESNENGVHIGVSSDFFDVFQKHIHIPFKLVQTTSWSGSVSAIKSGECDILPMAMKTPNRSHFLNFTQPYLSSPLVIATEPHISFIQNIEDLNNKKIGIVKDYAYSEILKLKYPEVNIVEVDSIQDGLSRVASHELFGFMGALATISHQFQEGYSAKLKITGRFDEKWELSVAIRKEDKILLSIFEKLTGVIDDEKQKNTLNKYIAVNYEAFVDHSFLYKVVGSFFIVLVIILLWNQRIHKSKIMLNNLYERLQIKGEKLQDINKLLEQANQKLEHISSTDKLTGICNRRSIDTCLANEIERSDRTNQSFSLMLIDVDLFKTINDTHGHQVGDGFLIELCQLLTTNTRKIDTFGRWGGEEFIIISPHSNDKEALFNSQRLLKKVEEHNFSIVKHRTVSIGVASYQKGDDFDSLLKRVDTALYEAKNSGRNKVIFK